MSNTPRVHLRDNKSDYGGRGYACCGFGGYEDKYLTSDLAKVTCKVCQTTKAYKKALLEEGKKAIASKVTPESERLSEAVENVKGSAAKLSEFSEEITIVIKGKKYTLQEAQELYDALDKVLGGTKVVPIPTNPYVPYVPYTPPSEPWYSPNPDFPHYPITCC